MIDSDPKDTTRADPRRGSHSCSNAASIGRLPGETSCLTLVWAVLDRASAGWRGLTMTPDGLRLLQDLRRSLLEPSRQLRPRTVAATVPADGPETVTTVA